MTTDVKPISWRPWLLPTPSPTTRRSLTSVRDGVTVVGYFVWSLMDNSEWEHGYAMRFGLIRVDEDTVERTPKARPGAASGSRGPGGTRHFLRPGMNPDSRATALGGVRHHRRRWLGRNGRRGGSGAVQLGGDIADEDRSRAGWRRGAGREVPSWSISGP